MKELSDKATAMGTVSSGAKNDHSFYLPPEAFDNQTSNEP
jgi:hypothetical protein